MRRRVARVKRCVARGAWCVGLLAAVAAAGRAQRPEARGPDVVVPRAPAATGPSLERSGSAAQVGGVRGVGWRADAPVPLVRQPWVRPLASLVVPGSGQLLGGQDRGLVYLATEIWILARAVALDREGRRERARFQELAFRVARAQFTASRQDGSFEYYESMTHFVESGAYDTDAGPGFAPESDSLSFNGSLWLLARRTYFANPDSLPDPASAPYLAALAFYQSRAVGGEFRWSWRNARLEQDVFRGAILASDDAFRAATNYFGALVLNHLGSAIDALITVRTSGRRLRAVPRVGAGTTPGDLRLVWGASF